MDEHRDLLANLESQAQDLRQSEKRVREELKLLEQKLAAICDGIVVFCSSKDRVLAQCSPDDYYRGHFSFDGDDLRIAYRSTEDDYLQPWNPDWDGGPTYAVKTIDDVPGEWLRVLLTKGALEELLPQVGEQLSVQIAATKEAIERVGNVAQAPQAAIASAFRKVVEELGYDDLLRMWKDTQAAIHTNPDAAITRASSLIESVCKHILEDAAENMPQNQDIQHLFKAAKKILQIDDDSQADSDLKMISNGLTTTVFGVGTLRTHFGDAHGRAPSQKRLMETHAQLAVSASGTVSTFLLERWFDRKKSKEQESDK